MSSMIGESVRYEAVEQGMKGDCAMKNYSPISQCTTKLQQTVAEMTDIKLYQLGREILKQSVSVFPLPFALVPWGHHITIVTKCKSVELLQKELRATRKLMKDERG